MKNLVQQARVEVFTSKLNSSNFNFPAFLMDIQKLIVSSFARYNLLLRPDTLKLLLGIYPTETQLETICSGCCNLGLSTNIIECKHIEQVRNLNFESSENNAVDVIKTLRTKLHNAITIVDPFEGAQDHHLAQAEDKIKMHFSRYENIKNLLSSDPLYVSNLNSVSAGQVVLMSIGSVIGRVIFGCPKVSLLGLLIQVESSTYHLTDGTIQVRLDLSHAVQINIYDNNLPKGLINVGHIVIVTGQWNEHENCVNVGEISLPFTRINQEHTSSSDINQILARDTFGSFKRVHKLLNQLTQLTDFSLSRQRALQFFPIESEANFTFWMLSEFSLTSVTSIQNFDKLLTQTESYKQEMILPRALILIGQFVSSPQEMRQNKPLAQEFCNLLAKHRNLLHSMLVFFVASAKDPPLAHALPHTPVALNLLLHSETLPENLHSLSNPVRIDFNGVKVAISQADISREMRKNHVVKSEPFEPEDVCETLWSQRNLGSYLIQQQIVYKWSHSQAMRISDETDMLVVADSTLPQFVYDSKLISLANRFSVNPGNFGGKGEFVMCSVDHGKLSVEKCKI